MTRPTVRVLGAERLERTMRRAAADIGDQSALNARQSAALARAMRDRAPRRSGRLVASIEPRGSSEYASASTTLYGAVQEYGSAAKNIRPQPFARPALEDQTPRYLDELGESIGDDLARVKGA